MICEWFLLCANEASVLVPHPILGEVPTCTRCVEKFDLEGQPMTDALGISRTGR